MTSPANKTLRHGVDGEPMAAGNFLGQIAAENEFRITCRWRLIMRTCSSAIGARLKCQLDRVKAKATQPIDSNDLRENPDAHAVRYELCQVLPVNKYSCLC
jgi:hypothetical protein